MAQHFYTTAPTTIPIENYRFELIACYVFPTQAVGTVPMYRWFNGETGDHLYTIDPNGELAPTSGFVPEGPVFFVFASPQPNTLPLYRWSKPGDHFYTLDPTGELAPTSEYSSEGIACYVHGDPVQGTVPLHRWVTEGRRPAEVTVLYHWEGRGKSGSFTIPDNLKLWRTTWKCEAGSTPSIALLNADNGGLITSFGESSSGEKLFDVHGNFKWDTRSTNCKLTASTLP